MDQDSPQVVAIAELGKAPLLDSLIEAVERTGCDVLLITDSDIDAFGLQLPASPPDQLCVIAYPEWLERAGVAGLEMDQGVGD
jgi:hypothetical protein